MKMTNTEFRNLAWKRLWADKWFGRLLGGGILLGLCGYVASFIIKGILDCLGVLDWQDYAQAVIANRQDLITPIPNLTNDFILQATSATVLEMFIGYIMAGITAYGAAIILLKCLKNEEKDWLGEAFGGFKCPFGMLWLMVRYVLIFIGWMFVAIVPIGLCVPILAMAGLLLSPIACGCFVSVGFCYAVLILSIPFYRYRFLWLVKAEHPEWSAGECIRACRKLMKGNKFKSFKLDCSYWKSITLMLLPLLVLSLTIEINEWCYGEGRQGLAIIAIVAFPCLIAFVTLALIVPQYISVGQGFFYEEAGHRARSPSDFDVYQRSGTGGV